MDEEALEAFREAVELAEEAIGYTDRYFVRKHLMNERLADLKYTLAVTEAAQEDV